MSITYKEKEDKREDLLKILNENVKKWFFSQFEDFSLPQKLGVMEIHKRNNVLISAPTGATKTLTAFLSILNELVDSSEKGILENKIYAVYVSPLKALNEDIKVNLIDPLNKIDKFSEGKLGIRVSVRTGDTTQSEKTKMLKKPPHILITTPESLAIVLSSKKFSEHLRDVQWCIIDEIHSLAENKRGVHLSLSIERLQRLSPGMTRIGLSATVAPIEEVAKYLVGYDVKERKQRNGVEGINEDYEVRDCKIIDVQFLKQLDLKVLSPVKNLIDTSHQEMRKNMYKLIHNLIQNHKTTLIFTNTRAATERVVDTLKTKYPKFYTDNIGAHHGSLSKDFRHNIESRLREGKLKVVVSSTSLELGIDIGYIDLVILLGSPKSVARALQRIGRSGHSLHSITKGRIIVLDRDDLIECSLLLKSAIEKKIDKIHIPKNSLDVLVQHVYGISIDEEININELYNLLRKSYCYNELSYNDFMDIIKYLNGNYVSLEDRNIYRKVYYDEEKRTIKARGRLARMLYMTNIGTIPDEAGVKVKIKDEIIGIIDEAFLERLRKGDVFVLGGATYEFLYSRGTTAQVKATSGRPPTVPSWFSETLPLSFDLANEIGRFRRLMEEHLKKENKEDTITWVKKFLYVDDKAANAIYNYFKEQYDYSIIPSDKKIVIEYIKDNSRYKAIFHTLYGKRVNDALSRAVGYIINKTEKINVEIGINDNGFTLATNRKINGKRALQTLRNDKIEMLLSMALEQSEVLKRRFRHCATRALMILRNYMGRTKRVGRQVISSMILMKAVKRINPNFVILKEAKREVLEDLMDIENLKLVIDKIEEGSISIEEVTSEIPSPFSFNLVLQGYLDVLKIDDKIEFLRRMHEEVLANISGKKSVIEEDKMIINKIHNKIKKDYNIELSAGQEILIKEIRKLSTPDDAKIELIELVRDNKPLSSFFIRMYEKHKKDIQENWSKKLRDFVDKKIQSNFNYHAYWESEKISEKLEEEERMDKALIDLNKALRKTKVSQTIKDDLYNLVRATEIKRLKLSDETKIWLENFLSGTIPFSWSDHLIKYIKEKWYLINKD